MSCQAKRITWISIWKPVCYTNFIHISSNLYCCFKCIHPSYSCCLTQETNWIKCMYVIVTQQEFIAQTDRGQNKILSISVTRGAAGLIRIPSGGASCKLTSCKMLLHFSQRQESSFLFPCFLYTLAVWRYWLRMRHHGSWRSLFENGSWVADREKVYFVKRLVKS